jgi:hypothetical protein
MDLRGWRLTSPGRGQQFGLNVLPGRRGKFGVKGRMEWEKKEVGSKIRNFGPNLPLNEANLKIAEAGIPRNADSLIIEMLPESDKHTRSGMQTLPLLSMHHRLDFELVPFCGDDC